jgi:acetaldehyde dehydrogenase/alcohol dehydrogenase
MNEKNVTNVKELGELITQVQKAQEIYASFSQEKVDEIFREAALAANNARITLAKVSVAENGLGIVEDKVIKNHFASEYIYNQYKDAKTCGILEEDDASGICKIADPVGVIAGIIPVTNPTSTTIFKALLALKTRNGIVFSPHPKAKASTKQAAEIVLSAAVKAGAPANIMGCIAEPGLELTDHLMKHPAIKLILATGGAQMVKAAYSSGKPAIGVSAGNTPVVVDEKADIKQMVSSIILSKTFDNGMICASEQSVIVADKVYNQAKDRFASYGGYFLNDAQRKKVAKILFKDGRINAEIVGQLATSIAEKAGIKVPEETKVLIAEVTDINEKEVFAHEKLSPVLAMYRADHFDDAVKKAQSLVALGGMGHTSVLYTNPLDRERINTFGQKLSTARVLINTPSSQGAIGDLYNFKLKPSLTLGCGSWGGNSVSENVGVKHLVNIKLVAKRQEQMLWYQVPSKIYFNRGALGIALEELKIHRRAFIVTDSFLFSHGYIDSIRDSLIKLGLEVDIFSEVEPDPTLAIVRKGAERMNHFHPDVILAIGGGSPIDAAKIMWALYEHPETHFQDLALRFMDIRKRIYRFPKMGKKAKFVAIPTTSGTGSEVTPFAVVTDEKTQMKYPIASYELLPHMAIVDADLVMHMPKALTAHSGFDAISHAMEAYVSVMATEYTNGQALQALQLLFKYLPRAYQKGSEDPAARSKVHNAATIAGLAFANAFLGVCHSMAHKIGAAFHLPHGLANAILLPHVIRYNATDTPTKQAVFSQYERPVAKCRYAEIADFLKIGGKTTDEKVEKLIDKVMQMQERLEIPISLKSAGIVEGEFLKRLDQLAEDAFDDQCTGANPRYPLISELKTLLRQAYYGKSTIK